MNNDAYFVSFDEGAVGKNLEHIPSSKNLAIQMLFDLDILCHNTTGGKGGSWNLIRSNIKDFAGIDVHDLVAQRDSTVHHKAYTEPDQEIDDFLSALYRENDQLKVLRLIGDYTHDQPDGGREWGYYFWTNYSKTPARTMLLSDLANQDIINQYNEDPWVHNTWYIESTKQKVYTNIGPRTQPEPLTPLTRFIYKQGYSASNGTAPANMYREPLYAFAVKRVTDTGTLATAFNDGTKITPVGLMKDVSETSFGEDIVNSEASIIGGTYTSYIDQTIYLNNEFYHFGMDN